jgi:hypothetical protein
MYVVPHRGDGVKLILYASPDGFRDVLHFWYAPDESNHRVRVEIRAKDLPPKETPDQLRVVRHAAYRALSGIYRGGDGKIRL